LIDIVRWSRLAVLLGRKNLDEAPAAPANIFDPYLPTPSHRIAIKPLFSVTYFVYSVSHRCQSDQAVSDDLLVSPLVKTGVEVGNRVLPVRTRKHARP
jgi:hypothetical protein